MSTGKEHGEMYYNKCLCIGWFQEQIEFVYIFKKDGSNKY